MDRREAERLARSLSDVLVLVHTSLSADDEGSAAARLIKQHLGVPFAEAVIVTAELPSWQHVSAHRALGAYVAQASAEAHWFGLSGHHGMPRMHADLISQLGADAASGRDTLSSPEYTNMACGPDQTEEVVSFGLVCTVGPSGAPAVVALRTVMMHSPAVAIEVLCARRDDAAALTEHLRALTDEHDILRGQVVSFGVSEHFGNSLVTFLPRPAVSAADVILPDGVLAVIDEHVAGPARHARRLKELGIHLKRGLLLHGAPGTGKTHTVRYLMGQTAPSTVVVLSGDSLQYIDKAAALARRLAPTIVVVEDVDLIAMDRSFSPTGNPLLFNLLDVMDGVAADADVTFVLTTNRVEDLESALAQRPGRVDLAVEIPLPDAEGRRRLLELYRGSVEVTGDLGRVVAATEGATASAMKELMRRAVLAALDAAQAVDDAVPGADGAAPVVDDAVPGADGAAPVVDDAVLEQVLAAFASEREGLTRALLGAAQPAAEPARRRGVVPARDESRSARHRVTRR